jgi:uncharacterized membrane protein YdcZ (DUF606 family)
MPSWYPLVSFIIGVLFVLSIVWILVDRFRNWSHPEAPVRTRPARVTFAIVGALFVVTTVLDNVWRIHPAL